MKSLADIATDANAKAVDFKSSKDGRKLLRARKYFRYSVAQGMNDVDLSEFEKIPYMESMTVPYIVDVAHDIEECAKNLVYPTVSS